VLEFYTVCSAESCIKSLPLNGGLKMKTSYFDLVTVFAQADGVFISSKSVSGYGTSPVKLLPAESSLRTNNAQFEAAKPP
jgi:hypothetical protein